MDNLSYLERPFLNDKVAVLGIPLDLGKDTVGTDKGPKAIHEAGLLNILKEVGCEVEDLGNIECPERTMAPVGSPNVKYLDPILKVVEEASKIVEGKVLKGNKVVVLGGDNTISIGSISGASAALKGDLGIIWIDAHGDINTDETTLSGNVHGMPIAAVLGLGNPKLTGVHHVGRKVKPENVVYIGLKDLDQAEIDTIRREKIPAITMLEIAGGGLQKAFEAIAALQTRVQAVWVCLDIDSMDEECAPGTPMATRGGLTYRESINLAKFIGKTCRVAGVDVSELAPDLDAENKTARLASELIVNYLGTEYTWYTRYMSEEMKKQAIRGASTGKLLTDSAGK
jgi:arginase